MNHHLRIFCAIELSDAIRQRIADHIVRLRPQIVGARPTWTSPDKLHITLKFLGDIDESRIPALAESCSRAITTIKCFDVQIQGTGAFYRKRVPHVLWIGVSDPDGYLAKLQSAVESECAHAGFERELRSFNPHITIARIRRPQSANELADVHAESGFDSMSLKVSNIVVVHSTQTGSGTHYKTLSSHSIS